MPQRQAARARKLGEWLERTLTERGVTAPSTWATEHGIDKTQLGRWKRAEVEPTLASICAWADALDLAPLDLLIAGGYHETPTGYEPPEQKPPPSLEEAINADPRLNDEQKDALLRVLATMLGAPSVEVRVPSRR